MAELSLIDLTNIGCTTTFTNNAATITYQGNNVLLGTCSSVDILGHVELPPPSFINAAIALQSDTAFVFVRFAHASLGSPAISMLLNALRHGYLPRSLA